MLVKAFCFRYALSSLPFHPKGHIGLTRHGFNRPASVSAASIVDIGSVPAQADELIQYFHERCTAPEQPFYWSADGLVAGTDELHTTAAGATSLNAPVSASRLESPAIVNWTESRRATSGELESLTQHAQCTSQAQLSDCNSTEGCSPTDASTLELDERCAATHPGSICCTSTAVEKDATHNSCIVTLRTTVKLTDSRLHVASEELEELAWLAARDAAAEALSALNSKGSLSAGRQERHLFVCSMLRSGTIRDAKRMENGFGHVSYVLTLEDKVTGRKMRAAFKPRVEGDCEGWHRVPVEVAAYQLNLLLGMDVVPPAVMRLDCDVDWTHYTAGGAFIYWCSSARQLNSVPMTDWSMPGPVLLSDTRILDVLIQNSDRHAGHFLYAEHWADGDYTSAQRSGAGNVWRGRMSPVLIDHAAGFRPDAFVCLDHENAFLTGPTRRISARTYLRLRFLDAPTLRTAFQGLISDEEVAALLTRRDTILSFFDGLVVEHGYDNVVLEV